MPWFAPALRWTTIVPMASDIHSGNCGKNDERRGTATATANANPPDDTAITFFDACIEILGCNRGRHRHVGGRDTPHGAGQHRSAACRNTASWEGLFRATEGKRHFGAESSTHLPTLMNSASSSRCAAVPAGREQRVRHR